MATVGFVTHSAREDAAKLQDWASRWLIEQGHGAVSLDSGGPVLDDVDLAVSLGGDGTMLRTVDLVTASGTPVLGVNVGHLGFLTEVEPNELCDALARFLAGEYAIEERTVLDVQVRRRGEAPVGLGPDRRERPHFRRIALNDVVLTRPSGTHTVQAALALAGEPFLTYAADSLIVATATGSTAYNLSARGPIASPRTRVQIVTPVAAHMLFDRSLVLPVDEEITLWVTDDRPAELVIDGQLAGNLQPGDSLHCTGGPRDARLVTFGQRRFHRILKRKFNLADR
jgi:NAD+ kinase